MCLMVGRLWDIYLQPVSLVWFLCLHLGIHETTPAEGGGGGGGGGGK